MGFLLLGLYSRAPNHRLSALSDLLLILSDPVFNPCVQFLANRVRWSVRYMADRTPKTEIGQTPRLSLRPTAAMKKATPCGVAPVNLVELPGIGPGSDDRTLSLLRA